MSGIFDSVQQQLSGGAVQQVAERTGINPALAQKAVTAAVPMILGGMAKHAAEPGNAAAIHAEADNHVNSAGVLGDLPAIFTGDGTQGGLLNKAMGQHHEQVQDGVAKAAGIDRAQAAKVIAVVAPVVLGAIALKKRQGQLTGRSGSRIVAAGAATGTDARRDQLARHRRSARLGDGSDHEPRRAPRVRRTCFLSVVPPGGMLG